jgi:hypothetical protein
MMGLRGLKQMTRGSKASHARRGSIGTLGERSLHSALKDWYAEPGDRLEAEVDGFHIDIVRGKLLIEIQTSNFSSQRKKLRSLTGRHHVRLVFPIAKEKWIIRFSADGLTRLGRRKSPKKGHLLLLFEELVSIPGLMNVENFSLEVLLIQEEEVRYDDGQGSWLRKGWSLKDHRLLAVVSRYVFKRPSDFLAFIPQDLSDPFSTSELAKGIGQPRWLAQKMAYCLRHMGTIEVVGKKGNSLLYSASETVGK